MGVGGKAPDAADRLGHLAVAVDEKHRDRPRTLRPEETCLSGFHSVAFAVPLFITLPIPFPPLLSRCSLLPSSLPSFVLASSPSAGMSAGECQRPR